MWAKYSTPWGKQEDKDHCIHSTSCKHLLYQGEPISNGKIMVLTVGMSVNGALLQAEFPTVNFSCYSLTSTCLIYNLRQCYAGCCIHQVQTFLCSLTQQHLKAPCCDQGCVVQRTIEILNKKYSSFREQPAKQAAWTKAGGKVALSPLFLQEAKPQRGKRVLRANLLCQ